MKKVWQWLATALLVAIFLSLANWQWNRAEALKKPIQVDQSILPIDSVLSPTQSVTQEMVGRKVSLEGKFVSNWIAPHQDGNKTWVVGLFQTKDNAMVLVVRGFHNATATDSNPSENKIVGYLIPPQTSDVADTQGDQIGRIDSSLFVSKTELPLYAPFVQAISEEPESGYQVVPFEPGKKVPGFYWQHISYVIIWFLFAITAIYLMLYQRRLDKVQL